MNDQLTMNETMECLDTGAPIVDFDLRGTWVSAGAISIYRKKNGSTTYAVRVLRILSNAAVRGQTGNLAQKLTVQTPVSTREKEKKHQPASDRLTRLSAGMNE